MFVQYFSETITVYSIANYLGTLQLATPKSFLRITKPSMVILWHTFFSITSCIILTTLKFVGRS